jgi:putative oxygen-independent coproporphyrinogen III oxidase
LSDVPPRFGVYVHWPYCAKICPYCDFNVYRARGRSADPLLNAIAADVAGHRARLGPRKVDSVFLGGGTPSLLSGAEIAGLLDAIDRAFGLGEGVEITLEANPEDAGRLADHVAAGVNRLSLGVQALEDAALRALGRWHDAAAAIAAVEAAAHTGARVSVDLIYARAGQTLTQWQAELARVVGLPVEHLSLYQLTIEDGTAFARAAARGALVPPTTALAADLFESTVAACAAAGFSAYEVSNFARSARAESRHNRIYWESQDWIGVGPGAHGRATFVGAGRCATEAARLPDAYIALVEGTGIGWPEALPLAPREAAEEALMMGLRLVDGVNAAPIEALLGAPLPIAPLVEAGLMAPDARGWVRITPAGRLLTDKIGATLLA